MILIKWEGKINNMKKLTIITIVLLIVSQFIFGQKWYQTVTAEKEKIIGPSVLKEAYKHWMKINDEVNKLPIKKSMLHTDLNLRNV